jgi:hypothetical protein
MANARPTAVPEPAEPESPFDKITVETKAGTFEFREVDGETYDKCVEMATKTKEVAGEEREITDMVMLLRVLADKSSVTDGLTIEKINKLPFSARQKVLVEVNKLYFPDDSESLARELRLRGWTVTAPKKDESPNA